LVEVTRHFSATTYVVRNGKVLLHYHKKLKMWLPVGGHVDRDELPHEAAIREVKEETGLDVELVVKKDLLKTDNAVELVPPHKMMLHNLNPFHQHIDMVFVARANNDEFNISHFESKELGWFGKEEIENFEGLLDDTRVLALEALGVLNES
jgi:8-oxo-dGTP pyrophosphatase MutT (NUDIX family)